MTKQEMFNLAVRGLRSQGWIRAYDRDQEMCVYDTSDGKRCAWGWVDRSLTSSVNGSVSSLHHENWGLAGQLDNEGLVFAQALQHTHDSEDEPNMEARFRELASAYGLEWPND